MIWSGHCCSFESNHFFARPRSSASKRNSHAPFRLSQSTPCKKLRCLSGLGYSGLGKKLRVRISSLPTNSLQLFLRDFAAPAQDLCLGAGSFGFLDITRAIVKQRETCP